MPHDVAAILRQSSAHTAASKPLSKPFLEEVQPPTDHPLWETEVELERGMLRKGADKLRDAAIVAEKRGQLTRVSVVRGLLQDWLPPVAEALKGWLRDVELARGGPKPIAYPFLKEVDPYVASLIAVREVLDGMAIRRRNLTTLAMEIGRTIEHEQKVRKWEAQEPALFYHYADEMDRNKATQHHRRRVNINRFNSLNKDGEMHVEWDGWNNEVRFRVGIAMLEVLIRKTGWFEIQMDDDPETTNFTPRKGHLKRPLVLAVKEGLTDWLGKALDHAEVSQPEFRPMVVPPRPWDGTRMGGYWTPYVKTPRLVRFKASQEHQKDRAADEYDAFDMPKVYEAIRVLQETPWRVNGRVLDVAKEAWSRDMQIAELPATSEKELPPRTPRMVEHAEAVRLAKQNHMVPPVRDEQTDKEIFAWKRKASPIYRFNAKRVSRMRATTQTIIVADDYRKYDRFYFPHMLDFRGRMYPIPSFLQPQGSDLARGILEFATGLPITEESGGAGWLAVHLAACWGKDQRTGVDIDKQDFDTRIAWVEENEIMWRLIAEDPLGNLEWSKADKPWQALAAIFEWVRFLDHGYGFVSHLPVMVDGTCNGIQHLSALTRDEIAGQYVNLVPQAKPQDIYRYVALEELQPVLERIEKAGGSEGQKATYWLELTGRAIPRTATKRQVMVLPYGGSKDSYFKYTREWLDKHDPIPEEGLSKEENEVRNKRIVFFSLHLWDAVNRTVKGGMSVMKWLQDCAKVVAEVGQPIYWMVPSGFIVRHFYGTRKEIECKILLDGERHRLTRVEHTPKLSTQDQLRGIAPNFIHSLDASALVDSIVASAGAGIESFASVHDAYGTHAANMWTLSRLLRQAFVDLHKHDLMGMYRGACERVLVASFVAEKGMDPLEAAERADEMLPRPLPLGNLDLDAVLESDYFFA